MAFEGVDRMIMHRLAAESEALTTVYEKNHIENTPPGLEEVYLTSRPVKMGDGAHAAMWVIEVRQGRMRSLSDPKVKFLKLLPESDGTKVRRARKRKIPQGLVAVQAKQASIAGGDEGFPGQGGEAASDGGLRPGGGGFLCGGDAGTPRGNIPKHSLSPYFDVMTVEEWAAESTDAHEFSYDVWAAGDAKDAMAPRLRSSMVGMMTELDGVVAGGR